MEHSLQSSLNYSDQQSITKQQSLPINVQPSPMNELRKIDQNLVTAKNRVMLLRSQLDNEKKKKKKNQQLTKDLLNKKSEIGKVNLLKKRDSSSEINRISELKKRNHSLRLSHEKSLEDIRKAIYLVKLDDAREVKNVSERLKRQLKEKQEQRLSQQQLEKIKRRKQSEKAKERYMQYWKSKISNVYNKNDQDTLQIAKLNEKKAAQLRTLEEEEIKLLKLIDKEHEKTVETKKQYYAALSLSSKDVAEAMGEGDTNVYRSQSMMEMQPKTPKKKEAVPYFGPRIKVPQANVDQNKLKIILRQLKKMQKNKEKQSSNMTQIKQEEQYEGNQSRNKI